MLLMGRYVHEVAGFHLDHVIIELQPSPSFQHHDPFVLVLVVPEAFGRSVAVGHDSLDTHVGVVEQSSEKLVGQVPGHVNEEGVDEGWKQRFPFRVSLITSIVKSACTVQSSKVVLRVYYMKRSNEQYAEIFLLKVVAISAFFGRMVIS
jgi:hypothetical protein